jgi:hypothetical protein
MTVSSSTNRVSYSGNGTLTTFAYTFKVFDQGDLTVILRSSTGTETVQTITTHYTVTGVGDVGGGNVVFVTAPSATETVVILREQDLTQGLDLVPNDPFPAQSLEESLDKLTFMVQQHEEELGRAIKASRTNTLTGSEFTISAADRANKVFAFDSSGDLSVTQELGTFKGNWAASTAYVERDLVKDTTTNDVFIVNSAHTSSGSLPLTTNTNSAKYDKIIDISNPPGDLTVGGNISTSGSVTAGSFVIGSADINENDLEAIDSVTAGTVAASKAVVVDVNKDISSFRNLTATGDITFGGLSDGTITVTAFVDEDNMASDSATLVPTQQSVKAYVDAQVATADALSEVLGNGNTTGGTNLVVSSGDTLDVDGALDASGTITLGGNFPTGTDNVALGSSALGAVLSTGERNTIIGSAAGDAITNGDNNTALGAGALGSITTQSSNTAVGRNALTSTTGTANTALGNGAGSTITSGQYNTVIGLFNGNQNSLDIRTSSNNVVLSDGQGNVRFYANSSGNVGLGSVSPDAELHISSSSSTPKIIIENSTNPRGNFIGVENNGDLVLGADEDSLSGSSAIRFKVDGTEVMSLDYQGTLALTGNATFGDNDKAIFSAGSDLQIKHTGTHAYMSNTTGNTYLQGGGQFRVQSASGENHFIANADGAVNLYYDNNLKLATTSTGVDITGTLTSDGLTVDGNGVLRSSTAPTFTVHHDTNSASNPKIILQRGTSDTAGGDAYTDWQLEAFGADYVISDLTSSVESQRFRITSGGDISFYEDTGTTAKFFWDASAESLGIGTNSPSDPLHIAATDPAIRFEDTSSGITGYSRIFTDNNNAMTFDIDAANNRGSSAAIFKVDGTERMRIDSSGNLLVGHTTVDSFTNVGHQLDADGYAIHTRISAPSLYVGRKTTDGSIMEFNKDGTTVGSIGSVGGSHVGIGSGDSGMFFRADTDSVQPYNPAGASGRDAAIDLGYSTNRFKDLYLSGGVYLGGTGSANKLDDYEEGTFTPSLGGSSSNPTVTYYAQYGYYTKVGRMVYISLRVRASAYSGGSGNLQIYGLPFTPNTGTQHNIGGTFVSGPSWGTGKTQFVPWVLDNGQAKVQFRGYQNNASNYDLSVSDYGVNDYIDVNGWYFT